MIVYLIYNVLTSGHAAAHRERYRAPGASKAPQGNERGAMGSKNPPAY